MAELKMDHRIGYGQVEPNHLAHQWTKQIYAQLPAADDIKILENGQFANYNYANGVVDFEENGMEWMMVWNEVKLYDDFWRESYKDFAMINTNYTNDRYYLSKEDAENEENPQWVEHTGTGLLPLKGRMTPRMLKTTVGDIMTTNTLCIQGERKFKTEHAAVEKDMILAPLTTADGKGFLSPDGNKDMMQWKVIKVYTMPDGQPGVKLQRIK